MNVFQQAYAALMLDCPRLKCQAVDQLFQQENFNYHPVDVVEITEPGRPLKPELVQPKLLKRRKLGNPEGRAALMHAIAHIEFNAINLALDAVYRFQTMPEEYYRDWIKVAKEEAYHFSLVETYLNEQGFTYGDFVAHNGLWEMACKTQSDVLIRMGLVPRILEARGLDVTPGIIERLTQVHDQRAVEILKIIYRDELGHVQIGNQWYKYCCKLRQLEPLAEFKRLITHYASDQIKLPIGRDIRLQAGFSESDISFLQSIAV